MAEELSLKVLSLSCEPSTVIAMSAITNELRSYIENTFWFYTNLKLMKRFDYPAELNDFRNKIFEYALAYRAVNLPAAKKSFSKLLDFLNNFTLDVELFEANLEFIIEDLVICSNGVTSTAEEHVQLVKTLDVLETEIEMTKKDFNLLKSEHHENEGKVIKEAAQKKEKARIAQLVGMHSTTLSKGIMATQHINGGSKLGIASVVATALLAGVASYYNASYLDEAAEAEQKEIELRLLKDNTLKVYNELNGATGNCIKNLCQLIQSISAYFNIVSSNTKQILESAQRSDCDRRRLRLEHARMVPQANNLVSLCRQFMQVAEAVQVGLVFLDTTR